VWPTDGAAAQKDPGTLSMTLCNARFFTQAEIIKDTAPVVSGEGRIKYAGPADHASPLFFGQIAISPGIAETKVAIQLLLLKW